MSSAPRVDSMNMAESEKKPTLGTAANKAVPFITLKTVSKSLRKLERSSPGLTGSHETRSYASPSETVSSSQKHNTLNAASVLRRHDQILNSNLSMNASFSSDASMDSFQSRASTGRLIRSYSVGSRGKSYPSKPRSVVSDGALDSQPSGPDTKKRCAWVTPNTDPCYSVFHDEEWGVPVHDDKMLFELLVLSIALAEHSWPTILSKRQAFREVFTDFDPNVIVKMNEKLLLGPGSTGNALLSDLRLRAVIENARQILKVIEEYGSFDKYIWSFVKNKAIVSKFRYQRQVPAKTPKAEVISKDLVRRGFRGVGPTVVYSFMQAAGITNDHLTSCFRFHHCMFGQERSV
uniref:Putative GMP synthase [glutamine-hydrolyzing] n=1 Tax=Noccaea caerulescens TaxID=107243 RepID=A0A1J3K3G0_NOCCA